MLRTKIPEIIHHLIVAFLCEPFIKQAQVLKATRKTVFENIVGKGENAGNQHFLLFPQCFLPFRKQSLVFESNL